MTCWRCMLLSPNHLQTINLSIHRQLTCSINRLLFRYVCVCVCVGFLFFRTSSTELHDTPRAASPIRSSFTSIRPSLFRSSCSKSSVQRRSRSGSVPLSWQRALVHMMMVLYPHGDGHPWKRIGQKDGRPSRSARVQKRSCSRNKTPRRNQTV